jgi:hypothetical protein
MGTKPGTVTWETQVSAISIDPISKQVFVEGVLLVQGYPDAVETYPKQDVTNLLTPAQKAAANTLAQGATAWMDAKLPA